MRLGKIGQPHRLNGLHYKLMIILENKGVAKLKGDIIYSLKTGARFLRIVNSRSDVILEMSGSV